MAKLTIMMGIPGSGKSTAAAAYQKEDDFKRMIVSRDEIRFSLVAEDEEYFSKEDEVFNTFCIKLAVGLSCDFEMIADATNLNSRSRAKLLNGVAYHYNKIIDEGSFKENVELCVYFVNVPLETALAQNENRKGTRAYVPESAIRNMYNALEKVQDFEGIDEVIELKG
jgi:predicted kinase